MIAASSSNFDLSTLRMRMRGFFSPDCDDPLDDRREVLGDVEVVGEQLLGRRDSPRASIQP